MIRNTMSLFNLFRKPRPERAEPSLDDVDLSLREIPGAVLRVEDFPRVHWPAVHEAVAPYREHPALHQVWTELAAQWLGVLCIAAAWLLLRRVMARA